MKKTYLVSMQLVLLRKTKTKTVFSSRERGEGGADINNHPSHLTVEHPMRGRGTGDGRYGWGGTSWGRRQRRAPGEVSSATDAYSGATGIEVVAVKVEESQKEGARVHLAGLLLQVPVGGNNNGSCNKGGDQARGRGGERG